MTQGGGDGLGDKDGVGDEREAEEPPGLLIQADVVLRGLPIFSLNVWLGRQHVTAPLLGSSLATISSKVQQVYIKVILLLAFSSVWS